MQNKNGYFDILGSGGILKKTIRPPIDENQVKADFGDEIKLRYTVYKNIRKEKESEEKDKSFENLKGEKIASGLESIFRIGDGDVIPAFELISRIVQVTEVVELYCEDRFAYAEFGCQNLNIPPHTALHFELQIVQVVSKMKSSDEMSNKEILVEANKKKEYGNAWFQMEAYSYAARSYGKARAILEFWNTESTSTEKYAACKSLLISVGNNEAHAKFKLEEFKDAITVCKEVLEVDKNNVKAFYRLAQIYILQGDLDVAKASIMKALTIEPKDKNIRALYSQIKEKQTAIAENEKKLFGKFINRPRNITKSRKRGSNEIGNSEIAKSKSQPSTTSLNFSIFVVGFMVLCAIGVKLFVV